MEISKSQKRLFVILGLVISFAVYDFISNQDQYLGYYLDKKPASKTVETKASVKNSVIAKSAKKEYIQSWGKDPFRNKKTTVVRKEKTVKKRRALRFNLKAISYMGANSVALINGSVVKVGDNISGYRVVNINPDRVVLDKNSKKIVLNLK